MNNYLNLKIGAKARLSILRKASPANWRKARYAAFKSSSYDLNAGFNNDGKDTPVLYSVKQYFPRETYCDEIEGVRIDHTGWFCDEYQQYTARGIVVFLPHGKILHGYELSDSGERVYFLDILDDAKDAARYADGEAELIAERMRENDQKYREAQSLADKIDDLTTRLKECLALRNNACFKALRREAFQTIEKIREAKNALKTDYAGVL